MRCQYIARMPMMRRNLHKLYRERTETDDTLGRAWYPNAHRIVLDWSDTYGFSIATVACVIAAISPQIDWPRNLIAADDVLAGRALSIGGPLNRNVATARRIAADRAGQITPYMPHGPKVASFACNLAGDLSVVTVDGHAAQAALCDVQFSSSLKWNAYAVFAEVYRNVANKLSIEPATFQAIIWHAWKRLHPRASKQIARRQWHVVGELED
jgi:hypothetical protein